MSMGLVYAEPGLDGASREAKITIREVPQIRILPGAPEFLQGRRCF
jgi:hypothetical protein